MHEHELGSGSFGSIIKTKCNGVYRAVKFEKKITGMLCNEFRLYNILYHNKVHVCEKFKNELIVPGPFNFASDSLNNFLTMDLCEISLDKIKTLKYKNYYYIFNKMISISYYLYVNNIIHRDIKPDNFMLKHTTRGYELVLIDFGLSKIKHSHLKQYKNINNNIIGTWRYMSLNIHMGYDYTYVDDIISMIYTMYEIIHNGVLPWSGYVKDHVNFSKNNKNKTNKKSCTNIGDNTNNDNNTISNTIKTNNISNITNRTNITNISSDNDDIIIDNVCDIVHEEIDSDNEIVYCKTINTVPEIKLCTNLRHGLRKKHHYMIDILDTLYCVNGSFNMKEFYNKYVNKIGEIPLSL